MNEQPTLRRATAPIPAIGAEAGDCLSLHHSGHMTLIHEFSEGALTPTDRDFLTPPIILPRDAASVPHPNKIPPGLFRVLMDMPAIGARAGDYVFLEGARSMRLRDIPPGQLAEEDQAKLAAVPVGGAAQEPPK
jgi:hypothetical protein